MIATRSRLVILCVFIFGFVLITGTWYLCMNDMWPASSNSPESQLIRQIDNRLKEAFGQKELKVGTTTTKEPNDLFEGLSLDDDERVDDQVVVGVDSNTTLSQSMQGGGPEIPDLSPEEFFALGELYQYGKFGRPQSFKLALYNFRQTLDQADPNDHELLGKCHLAMADLFESNHPSPHNVHAMLNHYLSALRYGYEESILRIGKLYANGLHPFYLPDKMSAAKIFTTFERFSDTIGAWCQVHLQDIYKMRYNDMDMLKQNDIHYTPLPPDIVNHMLNATQHIRTRYPYKTVVDRHMLHPSPEENDDQLLYRRKNANPFTKSTPPPPRRPPKNSVLLRLPKQVIHNDSQNVHDHSLQNIGNIIIDKLDKHDGGNAAARAGLNGAFDSNVSSLLKGWDEKKYPHVKRVCESLVGDTVHSRFNKTEQEVFNLVWDRVRDNKDARDLFMDSLNSSVEHDYVVCSTGKIMRMLSTIDSVDDNIPTLKPEWVIKQEIMQTIANTINKLTKKEKAQYESDNNDQIKNVVKSRVRAQCVKQYKDVLHENILDLYLKDYFEYL